MESQSQPDGKIQILLIAQTLLYFTDSSIMEDKDDILKRLCSKRAFATIFQQDHNLVNQMPMLKRLPTFLIFCCFDEKS